MGILNPEQKAILAAKLAEPEYSGLSVAEKVDTMNRPGEEVVVVTKPKPFTRQDILGKLSYASRRKVMTLAIAPKIIDAINAQDRQAIGEYADSLRVDPQGQDEGEITQAEFTAIMGVLVATEEHEQVTYGPSPFGLLFNGVSFTIELDHGVTNIVSGTCLPAMIEEALS